MSKLNSLALKQKDSLLSDLKELELFVLNQIKLIRELKTEKDIQYFTVKVKPLINTFLSRFPENKSFYKGGGRLWAIK